MIGCLVVFNVKKNDSGNVIEFLIVNPSTSPETTPTEASKIPSPPKGKTYFHYIMNIGAIWSESTTQI